MFQSNKGKLIVAVLAFVVLAMSSLACSGSDNPADAAPEQTLSQEEVDAAWDEAADAYWDDANAKAAIREEAIRRDAVVVEWRGDWNPNTRLALFHGQSHQSDVKVGAQFMDLVERDQTVLKEYKADVNGVESWATIASISNNLQPGSVQVFIR